MAKGHGHNDPRTIPMYPHTKFGIPTLNNIGDMLQTLFSRTMAKGHCHNDPRTKPMYPHTKFGIPTSNDIGDMLQTLFF